MPCRTKDAYKPDPTADDFIQTTHENECLLHKSATTDHDLTCGEIVWAGDRGADGAPLGSCEHWRPRPPAKRTAKRARANVYNATSQCARWSSLPPFSSRFHLLTPIFPHCTPCLLPPTSPSPLQRPLSSLPPSLRHPLSCLSSPTDPRHAHYYSVPDPTAETNTPRAAHTQSEHSSVKLHPA